VTLIQTRSLRSSRTMTKAWSRSKPIVGTTNRSIAAMSSPWLRKKVCHPWLGGPRRLIMYLATLDCATSNPSLSSSPWMRGAPQSGFSTLIRWSIRAAPCRSAVALPRGATSNASNSESRPYANARASRAGRLSEPAGLMETSDTAGSRTSEGAVAGWGLHPLESAAFSRRTPLTDVADCECGQQ
jgi:hypothetical protein